MIEEGSTNRREYMSTFPKIVNTNRPLQWTNKLNMQAHTPGQIYKEPTTYQCRTKHETNTFRFKHLLNNFRASLN